MTTIFGIPTDAFETREIAYAMSDYELYQQALERDDCEIYDDLDIFFQDLNNGCIDTENFQWFNIDL